MSDWRPLSEELREELASLRARQRRGPGEVDDATARGDGRFSRLPSILRAELPADTGGGKRAAFGLVIIAVLFNLWVLRAEALPVSYQNDSAVHLSMVEWASQRIEAGHLPLDGWFPDYGLGSAQFHHYQILPHIITGFISTLFGPQRTFAAVLYLLLALWPLCVFWSMRLFDWGYWAAGLAALVSPLLVSTPSYGYETGSYIWRGWGMWSQLWGMWLLPLAWALTWRALAKRSSPALAALAIALTVACHYLTGYLAFLSVGVLVLVRPTDLVRRLGRGVVVVAAALVAGSWVIVPILLDSRWIVKDEFLAETFYHNSFGAKRVLGWLWTGQIFDGRRFPIISILVLIGAGVCVARWRQDERARVPLALFTLSLLLFFGRPTLGPVLNLLPGNQELFLHRYIIGIHLAGILLAGIGAAWLGRVAFDAARGRVPITYKSQLLVAALMVVLAFVLAPAWRERAAFAAQGGEQIREQRVQDASDGRDLASLVRTAVSSGPGRMYAGMVTNWGKTYEIGSVPVYETFSQDGVDSIGFTLRTSSLSSTIEPRFNEADPAQYDMFNVRHVILPESARPPVPATRVAQSGRHVLWRVPTHGYLQLVDVVGPPIVADRADIGPKMEPFLASGLAGRGLYPAVSFAGEPAAPPTTTDTDPSTPPGMILRELDDLADGHVSALIRADRPAAVLLKTSFDPRWRVVVDGKEVPPQMFAPSFVGREVPAGVHQVSFTYVPFPRYDLLLALGILTLLAVQFAPRVRRRVESSGRHGRS